MNRREVIAGIAAFGLCGESATGARCGEKRAPAAAASPSGGWPDLSNTGSPPDAKLAPSKALNIDSDGAVVEALDIDGAVNINANNVTLRNCRIRAATFSVVRIKAGASGVTVKNCEIDGVGSNNDGSNGIFGSGAFIGNNIHHVENGVAITQGSASTIIENNYIHDLLASGSPHYDAIQIDGDISNVRIRHNTVVNPWTSVSAIMIDNYFGPIADILVENNILVGGGFTIYVDARFNDSAVSNVRIVDNHMGSGRWGVTEFYRTSPVYEGNVNDGRVRLKTLLRTI